MTEKNKKETILETRASDRILKAIGKSVKEEMDTLSPEQLRNQIVQSLDNMSDAAEQLSGNPVYQDLSRRLNDVTQGLKEVNKYQKGKIAYARQRLREMGKVPATYTFELREQLATAQIELMRARQTLVDKGEYSTPCGLCGADKRAVSTEAGAAKECYRCETLPRSQGVTV